ncbi:peptidoglycan-binding protein [Cohaesibacter sp. ES.047]|uniref:peptidoglycan-binding protein n=1 Tax=Cohaesibacter sp. ES.047 TaxID=1798205 RepID=UPI00155FF5D0|nr:peptidoglycan-binding protein [Cohaesibacter sp. ES.047]
MGSIYDVSQPAAEAMGQKLGSIISRFDILASDVGQVFGIALDPETSDIYLSASSAYGLFRTADNSDWADGMWGPGGGPGTIWRLRAETGYTPEIFTDINLEGRTNTGASLGNIAIDSQNRQLFVTDLESGKIHRLSLEDGMELGRYDHGETGRSNFIDQTELGEAGLAPVSFNPGTAALVDTCPFGIFDETPGCWNFADFRRRVFGVAVRKDVQTGANRLFYSVWGSQGFGHPAWAAASPSEKQNSLWSIGLMPDGSFDSSDIRREALVPEFFTDPTDSASKGPSHAVADLAFPACRKPDSLLVAERGGIRTTGLGGLTPPTHENESRLSRFTLEDTGQWSYDGSFEVGYPKRATDPEARANTAGGVTFGYRYDATGLIDTNQPDAFIWTSGNQLCKAGVPCFDPSTGDFSDFSEVDGMQGFPATSPTGQFGGTSAAAVVPTTSYMIDADSDFITAKQGEIGDIEVLQRCDPVDFAEPSFPPPPPPPPPRQPSDDFFDLELTKRHPGGACKVGQSCPFIIEITNVGSTDFNGPLYVSDKLPAGTIFDSVDPAWNCSAAGVKVDCYHPPVFLAPGDSVDLFMKVHLPPALSKKRRIRNCAGIKWMMTVPLTNVEIQKALSLAGYAVGPIDGVLGAMSKAAIKQFQLDNGLAPTGHVNNAFFAVLFGGDWGNGDINPANDKDCATVPLRATCAINGMVGDWPDCRPPRRPCPQGWIGDYQPNCKRPIIIPAPTCASKGLVGKWPNCRPQRARCPKGWIGKYQPNCKRPVIKPRPSCASKGMIGKWPNCKPRRARCPKGWIGKYQPNCKRPVIKPKPTCTSKGMIGKWPNCKPRRARCPKGWIGKYQPNCKRPVIKPQRPSLAPKKPVVRPHLAPKPAVKRPSLAPKRPIKRPSKRPSKRPTNCQNSMVPQKGCR